MLARMRDMSVTEQRYQAVLDVIGQGRAVMEVASQWGVSRRTVERWLARYEAQGLEGLPDRSHRPERCPHVVSLPPPRPHPQMTTTIFHKLSEKKSATHQPN